MRWFGKRIRTQIDMLYSSGLCGAKMREKMNIPSIRIRFGFRLMFFHMDFCTCIHILFFIMYVCMCERERFSLSTRFASRQRTNGYANAIPDLLGGLIVRYKWRLAQGENILENC